MRVFNVNVFNAVDASTNQTSSAYSMYQIYGWSGQFVFTGSPVGTLKVQVSCDPGSAGGSTGGGPLGAPTNWTDMANSSQAVSGAGSVVFNVNLGFYNWIRFVYTATSGTGNLSGILNSKGV